MRRSGLALGWMVSVAVLASGCMVRVSHVDDPSAALRAARAEADEEQGRPGPAHRLNVVVYEPEESKLVRVSVPMWLARRVERHVKKGGGEETGRILRRIRLDDLDDAGLGLIADVEDDDGSQVVVWLR